MKHAALLLWLRLRRRIGVAGIAALLLIVPLAVAAAWTMRLDREADGLRAALASRASAPPVAKPARRELPPGQQVAAFLAGFPPLAQNAADLDEVFSTAKRHNLNLNRGEYQLKAENGTPLVVYTATFPVRHDYASLKDFTSDVLKTLPHASLDELRMSRPDASSSVLDATVRFTFVYRGT